MHKLRLSQHFLDLCDGSTCSLAGFDSESLESFISNQVNTWRSRSRIISQSIATAAIPPSDLKYERHHLDRAVTALRTAQRNYDEIAQVLSSFESGWIKSSCTELTTLHTKKNTDLTHCYRTAFALICSAEELVEELQERCGGVVSAQSTIPTTLKQNPSKRVKRWLC